MDCLFCNNNSDDFSPESGNHFTCSKCVQILLSANQEELKRAYDLAIETGYTNKASAIESFLISQEAQNDRKAKKPKRGIIRKKPMRMVKPSHNQLRT